MIKLNSIEIDSLKLRIPMQKVEVIDPNLNAFYRTYNSETGEEIDEFKNNSLKFENEGISTRFLVGSQPVDNKGNIEEYLYILVNSKILKEYYFEGICDDNSMKVYDALISYNVALFSYDSFMNSETTDIDFKIDQRIGIEAFNDLISYLKRETKESNQLGKGCKTYRDKGNKGIQWSNRQSTQYKTNPFVKVYHKHIELTGKSKTFMNNFLSSCDIIDIVRTEFTVKNKKHIELLGIKGNKFIDLLSLNQEFKKEMLKTVMSSHLLIEKEQVHKPNDKMSPTESIIYGLIMTQMNDNNTYFKIRDRVLEFVEGKVAKSRKKKELDSIYNRFIKGSKKDNITLEINGFLSNLGID